MLYCKVQQRVVHTFLSARHKSTALVMGSTSAIDEMFFSTILSSHLECDTFLWKILLVILLCSLGINVISLFWALVFALRLGRECFRNQGTLEVLTRGAL